MADLKSKKWIVAKGVMFLHCRHVGGLIILKAILKMVAFRIAGRASCRFYYFLFYVLEHCGSHCVAGIWDLIMGMKRRRHEMRRDR